MRRTSNFFASIFVIFLFFFHLRAFSSMGRLRKPEFRRRVSNIGHYVGLAYLCCVGVILPTSLVYGLYGLSDLAFSLVVRRKKALFSQRDFDELAKNN